MKETRWQSMMYSICFQYFFFQDNLLNYIFREMKKIENNREKNYLFSFFLVSCLKLIYYNYKHNRGIYIKLYIMMAKSKNQFWNIVYINDEKKNVFSFICIYTHTVVIKNIGINFVTEKNSSHRLLVKRTFETIQSDIELSRAYIDVDWPIALKPTHDKTI